MNFKRIFCSSLEVSPCSSCDNMIRAQLAHRIMSLEQRGKVSTQITITQRPQGQRGKITGGGDFLGYGALKPS